MQYDHHASVNASNQYKYTISLGYNECILYTTVNKANIIRTLLRYLVTYYSA